MSAVLVIANRAKLIFVIALGIVTADVRTACFLALECARENCAGKIKHRAKRKADIRGNIGIIDQFIAD